MRQVKVSPSGIRGRVGQGLELDRVIDLVSAFATWLDGTPVLIARDTRPSSPMFAAAATAALSAAGCEVLDAGICPTAVAQREAARLGVGGAISVTASHNDVEWNGLKLFGAAGEVLSSAEGSEVLDLWHQGDYRKARHDHLGAIRDLDDVIERYLQDLLRAVDRERIARARLRVVIDAGNGAGAMVVPLLCRRLGVELIPLSCEPSGEFSRHPDPTAANLAQAAAIVRPVGAAVGFGLSSDCERVSLITDRGEALGSGATLPLILLDRPESDGEAEAEQTVVTTICSDSRVERIAERRGDLRVVRSGVGIQAVIERVVAEQAAVGGETSGGVALARFALAFDGLAVMTRLIEQVAAADGSAAALAAALPTVCFRSAQVPCRVSRAYSTVARLRGQAGGRVTDLDGVRVDLPEGAWYHLRVSHTEPVVRIACEARSNQGADDLLAELVRRTRAAAIE